MKKKKAKNEKIDIDPELELNSCSAYDCTGLIPSAVKDEAEVESFEEIYPYLTPPVKPDKDIKDIQKSDV